MNFTNFTALSNVISKIPDIDLSKITEINLENEGVDTDVQKILFNGPFGELLYILPNGKVSKVAVHISAIKDKYKNGYKYHIFNCETLHKMKYNKQEEKYKSNTRTDETFFMIMTDDANRVCFRDYYPLSICTHCMTLYSKKYQRNYIDMQEYYNSNFNNLDIWAEMPYDMEVSPQIYIAEWENISKDLKRKNNYRCERCNLNLTEHKKYLHAHHIDMNTRNNHSENIKILCIKCHGREPNHIHVNSSPDWKEFMNLVNHGVIRK